VKDETPKTLPPTAKLKNSNAHNQKKLVDYASQTRDQPDFFLSFVHFVKSLSTTQLLAYPIDNGLNTFPTTLGEAGSPDLRPSCP